MGKPSRDKGVEWRRVNDAPEYEVSEYGDVRRATAARTRFAGHILTGGDNGQGYRRYKLVIPTGKRTFSAHYLVCTAFNGPSPSARHEVAHNDGNRFNNHFTNLRWATRAENHADMQAHGTAAKGERNGRAKLTAAQVAIIRENFTGKHGEIAKLAREYGLSHSAMFSVCKGDRWNG